MYSLKEIYPSTWLLPQEGGMRVPGLIFGSKEICDPSFEEPLRQVRNVAFLPGIQGYSLAMPDIHWGYGFPIGGIAAMDVEEGVISPGGVGYDINCGVRLALIPVPFSSLDARDKGALIQRLFREIPSGVGQGGTRALSTSDYKGIVAKGARWAIEHGYGFVQDLEFMESRGFLEGGDLEAVSAAAQHRGEKQLGSIGSGNHFVEIGEVQEILLPDIAEAWGIEKGGTYLLIHSGSRGFGHQICQDTLDQFAKKGFAKDLPDKQLACAPIRSVEGETYFMAMAAAANFAFNNRQMILDSARRAIHAVLKLDPETIRLLYDVCHNIAKFEEHGGKKLCVHRKGATRAFGPGHPELNPTFRKTGQPVLVPGDMGRASWILVGEGNPLSFCSACHGAGRAKSRVQCLRHWKGRDPVHAMREQGVTVLAHSPRTIAEEMPDAYKDVDAVVTAVEKAKLARQVARLRPELVLKG